MQNLTVYRILTYILLAVGGVIALLFIAMLMAALVNPVLLLPIFVVACVLIYTYCSFRFMTRGIDAHMYCKPSLRDLIKVNGYGALFFASLTAINCFTLISRPDLLNEALDQAMAMQKSTMEGLEDSMRRGMAYLIRIMLFYSILLLVHIFITFRLLKQHADAFQIPADHEG